MTDRGRGGGAAAGRDARGRGVCEFVNTGRRARTHHTAVWSKMGFSHFFHCLSFPAGGISAGSAPRANGPALLATTTGHAPSLHAPPLRQKKKRKKGKGKKKEKRKTGPIYLFIIYSGAALNRLRSGASLVRASPSRCTCWNCHISHLLAHTRTHTR